MTDLEQFSVISRASTSDSSSRAGFTIRTVLVELALLLLTFFGEPGLQERSEELVLIAELFS